ncbi:MAG: hypothetical protein PHS73_00905 [Candidatus Peribacteraceae bacterium]|nr:hypothetical protein [Candidatus Peribacteraceae bacterium]
MRTADKPVLTVTQTDNIASLLDTLTLIDQMSERIGEDRSGDLGGGGQAGTGAQQGGTQQKIPSPREQALASLPVQKVMQEKLSGKIVEEVRALRRQIRHIPATGKPGAAFRLNKLYTRIRRLNGLLHELAEASYEVLRRLFIRVFVDEQPVL